MILEAYMIDFQGDPARVPTTVDAPVLTVPVEGLLHPTMPGELHLETGTTFETAWSVLLPFTAEETIKQRDESNKYPIVLSN